MASLVKTYQGDLTQSIARAVYGMGVRASDSASAQRDAAQLEIDEANNLARTVDDKNNPFAKALFKGVDPLRRGEVFAAALKHEFTPNPMGLLGRRFQKQPFSYSALNTGDRSSSMYPHSTKVGANSAVNPKRTGIGVPSQSIAKNVGQPFPFLAVGSDIANQRTGTGGLFQTKKGQPTEVKDKKLGKFLAAVSKSLSSTMGSMTYMMDENEESLITVKEGILGTIKKLEFNSDLLETKLDAIIDSLRQQNTDIKKEADVKEADKKEAEIEQQKIQYEGEVIQKRTEDDAEFAARDARDEAEDEFSPYPSDTGDMWKNAPEMARGGIVDGPQSGYPAVLHGKEAVIPLDTPFTRQNYSAGTMGGNTSTTNNIMNDQRTAPSFEKFVPNMFNQIIESKVADIPQLKDTTEMLGKAVELPVKASGIVAFNVLGKALKGMQSLAGDVSGPLKTVLSPLTAFGVENSVVNSLTRDLNVGGAAVQRQESNKSLGEEQEQGNMFSRFFNNIKNLINPGSGGSGAGGGGAYGGGYRGGGYRGGGMYAGGGPGNVVEGAKNWWNRGRNVRVSGENSARWFGKNGLMADDAKQLTRTNKAFKSGATGVRGWNPFKAFTPEMVKTGPTPAVRQAFERPIKAAMGIGKGIGTLKGGLLGLILNELINPAPVADGTLTGNAMSFDNSTSMNRTDRNDRMNNFINLRSFENQSSKINNFEAQQSKIIEINNQGVTSIDPPESPMEHISNNPDRSLDTFFSSPYNY
jgi:uncharacterized membrane protein YgcG